MPQIRDTCNCSEIRIIRIISIMAMVLTVIKTIINKLNIDNDNGHDNVGVAPDIAQKLN